MAERPSAELCKRSAANSIGQRVRYSMGAAPTTAEAHGKTPNCCLNRKGRPHFSGGRDFVRG